MHNSRYNYGDNWQQVAHQVKKRDDYTCQKCGRKFPANSTWLHVHHKIPLSQGGDASPENLITLCRDCHSDEHPHMRKKRSCNGNGSGSASSVRGRVVSSSKRKYKPLKK